MVIAERCGLGCNMCVVLCLAIVNVDMFACKREYALVGFVDPVGTKLT